MHKSMLTKIFKLLICSDDPATRIVCATSHNSVPQTLCSDTYAPSHRPLCPSVQNRLQSLSIPGKHETVAKYRPRRFHNKNAAQFVIALWAKVALRLEMITNRSFVSRIISEKEQYAESVFLLKACTKCLLLSAAPYFRKVRMSSISSIRTATLSLAVIWSIQPQYWMAPDCCYMQTRRFELNFYTGEKSGS